MPQLNSNFTFYICSHLNSLLLMKFLYHQKKIFNISFRDFKYDRSYYLILMYFQEQVPYSLCHIYSYPYELKYYHTITNNFPGGLFKYVREISLYDERPFEHEFFHRIAQSFPFMKKLTISNREAQMNKRREKSKNDDDSLSIINYCRLTELRFCRPHEDYLEEFLLDTKTYLLNNVYLYAGRELLEKVTDNFTRDATRLNCSKIIFCYSDYGTQLEKHVKDYFFNTDIRSWFT